MGPARLRSALSMRTLCVLIALCLFAVTTGVGLLFAGQDEAVQEQQVRQRIRAMIETNRAEMVAHGMTNQNGEPLLPLADDSTVDAVYRMFVVHPAFGLGWDEVPSPNLTGTNANRAVNDFVATNGWNMRPSKDLILALPRGQQLTGLPWKEIHERAFPAFTSGGILFVPWCGFGVECSGVAYNPGTNRFPNTVNKFKPIGEHWYVWTQTRPPPGVQKYEGQNR